MNTPNGLPKKIGNRENSQLRKVVLLRHRNGVCDDYLLEEATRQPFDSWRAINLKKKNIINRQTPIPFYLKIIFQFTPGFKH